MLPARSIGWSAMLSGTQSALTSVDPTVTMTGRALNFAQRCHPLLMASVTSSLSLVLHLLRDRRSAPGIL